MASKTLLAIDQGTTSSRAIIFSAGGDILDVEQKELELFYPHNGWVEQDASAIWDDTLSCVNAVLGRADDKPLAIGITNQRETTVIWDRATGEPVYNAIVWQDRRTADLCADLKEAGHEPLISEKTGLIIDPYFSGTKIAWILENVEGVRERAEAGELAFGTIECWLVWKLTGGKVHASDASNACRSMLYNIREHCWDDELLELLDIPRPLLPEVKDNVFDYGAASALDGDLHIMGMAGDQQSALIGQGCFEEGMVKSTYGTGCFALMNIGEEFKPSHNRLLTTIAYSLDGKVTYALEGSIFVAGAAIQWLRDGLEAFEHASESEPLATSVNDNGGVYFVPAFTGLGAPHWAPEARGLICGLGRDSTKAHIVRAALEAQAYQTLDLMAAMEEDGGASVETLRVDGGLVANGFMCQFLADMLERPVEVPKVHEATAWGAAVLAGLGAGLYESPDEISAHWRCVQRYEPSLDTESRVKLYKGWQKSIAKTLA